jgi:hypothetical protein
MPYNHFDPGADYEPRPRTWLESIADCWRRLLARVFGR